MADETVNETATKLEAAPLGERVSIALMACYQIETLMGALVDAARQQEPEGLPFLAQAIGTRTYDLSGLIMGALHDDCETRENLSFKLNLRRA